MTRAVQWLCAAAVAVPFWLPGEVAFDEYGGWADGPSLTASGNFRTEKIDGKWWLVDPCGHLFFSLGVQAVNRRSEQEGNAEYLAFVSNKYGSVAAAGAAAHRRLREWGLNTVGPWSGINRFGRTPYCGHLWVGKLKIKASQGWWGKFPDPFAETFRDEVVSQAKAQLDGWGAPSGRDSYCIGYFVNNEMSWSKDDMELARSVIRSPDDQPAKIAFRGILSEKYGAAKALSEDLPEEDLKMLERALVSKFFSTVSDVLKEVLPEKLFLGSRIAWGGRIPLEECARYADVVSVNSYRFGPNVDLPPGSMDKPMLVSEFQFCAKEGEFTRCGMLEVSNQMDRATCYREYVRTCLEHPRYVGAHWFQWLDSPPKAGNEKGWIAQSGLVNIHDEPYSELVASIRRTADEMYPYRAVPSAVVLHPWERIEGSVYYADQPGTYRVWGGERNAKSFLHALGKGRRFTSGRLVVRKDRWTKGVMYVEASADDKAWRRLGETVKGEFFEANLPPELFPTTGISIRFNGEEGASYELNGYSLDLTFMGPQAWLTGSDHPFYRDVRGSWLDPLVWTCTSNRKVPRFGRPACGNRAKSLQLALAANETEAVQLVVSPQANMRNVRIEAEVKGLETEVLYVDWRRVTNPTDSSGVRGFWPDPIRPQNPTGLTIPRGSNRSFWIRVQASKTVPKGLYRGIVKLHEKGDEGKPRVYPIEVRIFGFSLPDALTLKTNFGFDACKIRAFGGDPAVWQQRLDAHHMTRFGVHGYKYVFDEPTTNQYEEVRRLCEESRKKWPHLRRLVTEPPCPELQGAVDIWCPRTDDYDERAAAACRARGESYWWYVCCGPKHPYAGLFVDRPGHELRLWLWQTWAAGIDGVLIWHTHWLSSSRDDNGDGTFFYPDASGRPIDTVRAESFRDGVEDYEYFAILRRLDPQNPLLTVPRDVSVSLKEFSRDPAALESHRIKLADEIERKVSK